MQVQRVVLSEPLSSQLQKVLDMDILREWSKPSETSMITIWSVLRFSLYFVLLVILLTYFSYLFRQSLSQWTISHYI